MGGKQAASRILSHHSPWCEMPTVCLRLAALSQQGWGSFSAPALLHPACVPSCLVFSEGTSPGCPRRGCGQGSALCHSVVQLRGDLVAAERGLGRVMHSVVLILVRCPLLSRKHSILALPLLSRAGRVGAGGTGSVILQQHAAEA